MSGVVEVRPRFQDPDVRIEIPPPPSDAAAAPAPDDPPATRGLFTSMADNKLIVLVIVIVILIIAVLAYVFLKKDPNDGPKQPGPPRPRPPVQCVDPSQAGGQCVDPAQLRPQPQLQSHPQPQPQPQPTQQELMDMLAQGRSVVGEQPAGGDADPAQTNNDTIAPSDESDPEPQPQPQPQTLPQPDNQPNEQQTGDAPLSPQPDDPSTRQSTQVCSHVLASGRRCRNRARSNGKCAMHDH